MFRPLKPKDQRRWVGWITTWAESKPVFNPHSSSPVLVWARECSCCSLEVRPLFLAAAPQVFWVTLLWSALICCAPLCFPRPLSLFWLCLSLCVGRACLCLRLSLAVTYGHYPGCLSPPTCHSTRTTCRTSQPRCRHLGIDFSITCSHSQSKI